MMSPQRDRERERETCRERETEIQRERQREREGEKTNAISLLDVWHNYKNIFSSTYKTI